MWTLLVGIGAVLVGYCWLYFYWPSMANELQLQYQCHLNESYLALENTRLNSRIEECRRRDEKLRENLRQCENEIYNEHSAANRSFWGGFFSGIAVLTLFVASDRCLLV